MAFTFDPQQYQITPQQIATDAMAQGANEAATQYAQAQSVNNAIQRGAQIQQQAQSGLLGSLPSQTEQQTTAYQQGLLGYKDQWAQANRAYQQAQAANDANAMAQAQQGMKDANDGANVLRAYAQKNGVDLDSAYAGADNTRAQLAAAINAQNAQRYGRLLDSPDSATYYDNVYNNAIANGASRRTAQRVAAREAQQYQAKRLADLSIALQDRGISQGGFINQTGAQIMAMMYDEDPTGMAQVYNSYFGKPVNLGMWNLSEKSQDTAQGRRKDLMGYQEGLQKDYATTANDLAIKQLNAKGAIQKDLTRMSLDAQRDMNNAKIAAMVNLRNNGGGGGGSKNGSDGSGSDGLTKSQINGAGDAESLVLQLISSAKSNGDMDLDKYFQKVAELKNVDSDTKEWLKTQVPYAYNFVREFVRNKDGNMTKQYWRAIHDDQHLRGFVPADYAQYMESNG